MGLTKPIGAIINIAYNNELNKVEDFNITNLYQSIDSNSECYNKFAKKIIRKSRLNTYDIQDVDISSYYLPDLNYFSVWPDKPEIKWIEKIVLPYLYAHRELLVCNKNTLVIEFKRLAAIGKDIKQIIDLQKAPKLILKYKNDSKVTEKQIGKLLEHFRLNNIYPRNLPYQIADDIINALIQTQYYQQSHFNITSSLVKSDYIHPLHLFLSHFIYSPQDITIIRDLYRLQNSNSQEECLQLIRQYKDFPDITGKQAEILSLKLNPANLYNLEQFQIFNPTTILQGLLCTKYNQENCGQNYIFSSANSLQEIKLLTKIAEIQDKINATEDPDEKELLKNIQQRYNIEKISNELTDIRRLKNHHISLLTINRIQAIISFIDSHISYSFPKDLKTIAQQELTAKQYIIDKKDIRQKYIMGLSPVPDLNNQISHFIDSVLEGKSRLISPSYPAKYVTIPELKNDILSEFNNDLSSSSELLHTKFIFPNITLDKEDFIVEKILNNYIETMEKLNSPAIAFLSTSHKRIDLDIIHAENTHCKEIIHFALPQWIEEFAQKYHYSISTTIKDDPDIRPVEKSALFEEQTPKVVRQMEKHI